MAATRLIALHKTKGHTVAQSLGDKVNWSQPIAAILSQWMKSSCCRKDSTTRRPEGREKTML